MITMRMSAVAAAAAAIMSLGTAQAGPAGPMAATASTADGASLVHKVHGWHRDCQPGPAGWHRHAPGAGRIPCGPPGPVYREPRYDYRAQRREARCAGVYNMCFAQFGRGSPGYYACMRRERC
jgi:hypothetical protein